MNKSVKYVLCFVTSALVVFQSAGAFSSDLLTPIDSSVLNIHNFSVISSRISSKSTLADAKKITSVLNAQLNTIKQIVVQYDHELTNQWLYLGEKDNQNYPARSLLKTYDLQVFQWFNFELASQSKQTKCFDKKTGELVCVLNIRKDGLREEFANYQAMTKTLTALTMWRKRFNR